MNEFIFGVFHKGQILFPIGRVVTCSHSKAEFICLLFKDGLKGVLQPGDYFAYDFAETWRVAK